MFTEKNAADVLLINSLDKRYGSTYRARNIFAALTSIGCKCTYVESNYDLNTRGVVSISQKDTIPSYIAASIKRAMLVLPENYSLAMIQKITPLTFFAIAAALMKGKPLIVDWDDLDAEFQSSRIRKYLIRALEALVPRYIDVITTHSKTIADYAAGKGARRVSYLPQVIDTELFNPDRFDRMKEKKYLGIETKTVLGYTGTLTEGGMRDIDIILDFFKEGCSLDRYCLLIAGGGPLKNRLEAMIREKYGIKNYIITGILAQNEMPRYISAMDACFVYMRENIGNKARVSLKLLEYLAMQKVVFGKVVGDTNDILGKYVYDFSDFKPDGLERLIETRRLELEEARKTVKEKYSMESLKASLGELLLLVQKCR